MTSSRSAKIDRGEIETKNLSECLAVDFATLFGVVFPDAPPPAVASVSTSAPLGILARMDAVAGVILDAYGPQVIDRLQDHTSDTARGWGAFVIGRLPQVELAQRLTMVRSFADDDHFGVREWAWMAVRKQITLQVKDSMKILTSWTKDPSPRIRRFASESTRPRGVWAAHISLLKECPELGLPVLEPLNSDPERYVQDSVANWLNDAAKSQPKWVKQLCQRWSRSSNSNATAYIVKRARRSLK